MRHLGVADTTEHETGRADTIEVGSRWEARYDACSTASADSVTRWEPPRIVSNTSTRSRGFIPAYRPMCPAKGPGT